MGLTAVTPAQERPTARAQLIVSETFSLGVIVGIAPWLMLDLDSETSNENRPSPKPNGATWAQIVYRFAKTVWGMLGGVVKIIVRHDRQQISVDLAA